MSEATAWWTEVEELRERIERRRSLQADSAGAEPRRARATAATAEATDLAYWAPDEAPRSRDVAAEPAARRTVQIRGQAIPTVEAPRLHPADRHQRSPYGTTRPARPRPRPAERMGANPDRMAAWAFALALLTLLVAAISAHGL
jgi:hypothetical protein